MKRFVTGLLAAAFLASPALATEGTFPYTLNVHLSQPSYSGCAEAFMADANFASCANINVNWLDFGAFTPNFAWVMVSNVPADPGTGVGLVQYGLEYSLSAGVGGFTLCTGGSAIDQAGWPASGTGTAVTWGGGCYFPNNAKGTTKVGFIAINPGSVGTFKLVGDPRLSPQQAIAADCSAIEYRICSQALGQAGIGVGSTAGVNTCDFKCFVPTQEESWGSIKSIYAN